MSKFWLKTNKTARYFSARAAQKMRGIYWDVFQFMADRPVFLVGCSRAGTTLVYKTLSLAPELGSLQRETHEFWEALHPLEERGWSSHRIEAADASNQDRDSVTRYFYAHTGSRRFVDKNNQIGLSIPYLLELFPNAIICYVKRSPGDNINSLIQGWGRPDEYAAWSIALPEALEIENGKYTRWCFFLPQGWRAYTKSRIEEVCAFQYTSINEAIMEAKQSIAASQWAELKYEDILSDAVGSFKKAFENIGINFSDRLHRHCATVLSNPYNAFSEIRVDKWRDGADHERIKRVLPSVAETAMRMGYPI
jgi:hypothetical protein